MDTDVLHTLRQEIINLQGYKPPPAQAHSLMGLGAIESVFPYKVFPTRVVHELSSYSETEAAATNGFIAALLGKLLNHSRKCIWIAREQQIYPPAFKSFGIEPEQVLFVEARQSRDILWILEESLKCETLVAVVGATDHLSFTESRRLQLAVEQSHVTGFIHRVSPRQQETIACAARWHIQPLPSVTEDNLPGMGFAQWNVALIKARNGQTGEWQLQWKSGQFHHLKKHIPILPAYHQLQTG
jgi:protein ImuA